MFIYDLQSKNFFFIHPLAGLPVSPGFERRPNELPHFSSKTFVGSIAAPSRRLAAASDVSALWRK
jgi:hypothetical protein